MDKNTAIANFHQFLRNNNLEGEDISIDYLLTTIHDLLENNRDIETKEIAGVKFNFFERDFSIIKDAADADEPIAQFVLGVYLWRLGGERSRMRAGVRYIKMAASNGNEYASAWLETDKSFLNLKDSGYDA